MSKYCLTLIGSPETEEKLVDTVLVTLDDAVFTSAPSFTHGMTQGRLSNAEQVMGRSRSVRLEIIVTEPELSSLLDVLRQSFHGTGLRYWALPLAIEGVIE